jgi:[ribosomal protein S5]-alanine N-acetyltransferase
MRALELPTTLHDDAVRLRAWSPADVPAIAEFGLDEANVRWGEAPAGRQDAAARSWLAGVEEDRRARRGLSFAVVEATRADVLGNVDLRLPLPHVGELGYLSVPRARGRGTMGRALRLVVGLALPALELGRVQAFVSPDNDRSMRLLDRLGFAREGLLRSYRGPGRDRVAFSLLPGELSEPPGER